MKMFEQDVSLLKDNITRAAVPPPSCCVVERDADVESSGLDGDSSYAASTCRQSSPTRTSIQAKRGWMG